jgi:ABC-type glycerol-3-phosphate transport system permease component
VAAISSIPMLIIFFTLSQNFIRGANVFSAGKE